MQATLGTGCILYCTAILDLHLSFQATRTFRAWIGLKAVSKSASWINWKSSDVSTPSEFKVSSRISFIISGRSGKTSVMAVRKNVGSKWVISGIKEEWQVFKITNERKVIGTCSHVILYIYTDKRNLHFRYIMCQGEVRQMDPGCRD